MKIIRFLAAAFIAFAPAVAFAQAPSAPASTTVQKTVAQAGWDSTAPMTVAVQAPAQAGGGIINIGQAFGTVLQPYVDAVVQALIVGGVGWVGWIFKTKLGVTIDQGQRDALTKFLENAASSLVAAGAVQMQGKTVTVGSAAMAAEVNSAITRIPDALAHFGLDAPGAAKLLEDKIVDAIPQVPAGAAIIAQAHATASTAAPAAAPAQQPNAWPGA